MYKHLYVYKGVRAYAKLWCSESQNNSEFKNNVFTYTITQLCRQNVESIPRQSCFYLVHTRLCVHNKMTDEILSPLAESETGKDEENLSPANKNLTATETSDIENEAHGLLMLLFFHQ